MIWGGAGWCSSMIAHLNSCFAEVERKSNPADSVSAAVSAAAI